MANENQAGQPSNFGDGRTHHVEEVLQNGGTIKRTTVEEVTSAGTPQPTKEYRLRPGVRHFHSQGAGLQIVKAGETVFLTQQQAKAFADRFEPVNDSGFEVRTAQDTRFRSSDEKQQEKQQPEEGPQGAANPQPPIAVRPPQAADPNAPPRDATTLHPDRQGQETNEQQRQRLDNKSPLPAAVTKEAPASAEEASKQAADGGQSTGAQPAGAPVPAPPSTTPADGGKPGKK